MAHLTTYAGKGSGLTYGEMDANLNELERRTGDGWFDVPMEITVLSLIHI